MIKFKILCLICLCFVLSKVIGVEKLRSSNDYRNADQSMSSSKKVDNLVKQTEKSKKNDKIKLKDEQFQVLKGGSDLQLQKNSMQNSFQAVYGQAFIVDDPVSKAFEKTKSTKVTLPKSPPVQAPVKPVHVPTVKPKEDPPVYHFNRRAIVYQCCRYVFPAELYHDHLLFYSKYGHTYSNGETLKPSGHHLGAHLGTHFGQQLDGSLGGQVSHLSSQLSGDSPGESPSAPGQKQELEKETSEPDEKKAKINEKPLSNGGKTDAERSDYSVQPSTKSEKPNDGEEDSSTDDGSNERTADEKSNEKLAQKSTNKPVERPTEKSTQKANGKSNERTSEKTSDEPDEAATGLFKTWTVAHKQLYNFGSCTPIYDLSQTNSPTGHHPPSRWPLFG